MTEKDELSVTAYEAKSTWHLENILREIRNSSCGLSLEAFDLYPIAQIRDVCLKQMRYGELIATSARVDWAETRIMAFLGKGETEYWQKLLSWYVFQSCGLGIAKRALEFAIDGKTAFGYNLVSKLVAGRVKNASDLYWSVPSMNAFIKELLENLSSKEEYDEKTWHGAERALRMIAKVKDVTFLPKISELARLYKDQIELCEVVGDFTLVMHSAMINRTEEILTKAKGEQFPDLNATLGAYLRKKAGLTGSVNVYLISYEKVSEGDRLVRLRIEPTNFDEAEKLANAAKSITATWYGEGFDSKRVRCSQSTKDRFGERESEFYDGDWAFHVAVEKGKHRFSLSLHDRQHSGEIIVDVYRYVRCE